MNNTTKIDFDYYMLAPTGEVKTHEQWIQIIDENKFQDDESDLGAQ